ncbi:MAG: hypothetical protein IJ946_08575 [Clostridia bacterium]|nr:hypothetical protein [Clostridia bacterium]
MNTPKYRVLWTWDLGSNWDISVGNKINGCSGKNFRREAFLNDYKRMVDYASAHHFNGIVIWGALRAHNNGLQQFKELVKYGREKGVRIMPGISAFSYGGVFYDPSTTASLGIDRKFGTHKYSLNTWLNEHPEYMSVDENGKPYPFGPMNVLACPSRPENLQWFKEALAWLYDEFDIDGIQVEVGDYSVCHCPLCEERRKGRNIKRDYSVEDMLNTYTAAVEVSKSKKKDAWVLCETYSGFTSPKAEFVDGNWQSMPNEDRKLLSALPEGSILQWAADKAIGGYATDYWPDDIYTPKADNILRVHAGSQYSAMGMGDWAVELIWQLVTEARKHDVNGVSIFGEESFVAPPNEANYLAFEEACGLGRENSELSIEKFYANTLDPLYGGSSMATKWRDLYIKGRLLMLGERAKKKHLSYQPLEKLTDDPDFLNKAVEYSNEQKLALLDGYYNEVLDILHSLKNSSSEIKGRWTWLGNDIRNMIYVVSTRNG